MAMVWLAWWACAAPPLDLTPIAVDATFQRRETTGDELARFEAAAAYSSRFGGRAVTVLRGDTVIFERGQNGHSLDEPHHLFSGTKSFSCALMATLEAEGGVSAGERIRDTLPELPLRAATATVDQVLHLTTGMEQNQRQLTTDLVRGRHRVPDRAEVAMAQPYLHEPGERFEYGSAHFALFGEWVERRTGRGPKAWMDERIFEPIGMRTAHWLEDPSGRSALAFGAFTTANEWAKFGVLVRDDGAFLGERVLPAGALAPCFEGSSANPAYGRTWWLNQPISADVRLPGRRSSYEAEGPLFSAAAPDDLVIAAGYQGQRLYVVPSLDLVVVRLGEGWGFRDPDFLALLLGPTHGAD